MDHLVTLLTRQADSEATPECTTGNEYDGRMGLRIASIFVIWFGSTFGAVFPVFASKHRGMGVPDWSFFVAKFFGSGVIIATAFIHLLSPAEDALRDPCLTGPITEYDWVSGIVLMTIFVLFIVELFVMRYSTIEGADGHGHSHSGQVVDGSKGSDVELDPKYENGNGGRRMSQHHPGNDHLGHAARHNSIEHANNPFSFEDYKAQLTSIFILEFGIIFHSVFVGLTLAVAGEEFVTLFIVIVFHQTFEGLGLGARIASTPWPKGKNWTPYLLGIAYGFTTPIAIAIGLGVRQSYPPGSRTTLLVNGVFDSISAGILIYTGLVELMAHEFMFSRTMRNAPLKTLLGALALMCLGAALMALLGKWA
ncbi:low-affinity Zn(2+) transporter zrt2 [Knufia obscura]|uniref:Low-affinity Zn(2+) transporter zrt2 n=2 Tax=Knufia TaxID=430999 RepID=A0AAN8EED8_9EURO|nr:low-affinity Zn(2+) transporter zrt2 [Knufia obscura]KAK5952225.1 low-affinity Zn(2+) transporter zrt2 [Knufia fluminis]